MSSSVNKVTILGNLGRDPELRYMQNGSAVANLSIATTRKWRNKQTNEMAEETEWHRVSVFGSTAEACSKYLTKGRTVYIEGRLQTRSYDKDGQKHYTTEIVANDVVFLGGGGDSGKGEKSGRNGKKPDDREPPEPYDPGDYGGPDELDDSIPF